ncbi:MAG: hypothetical protein AB7P21_00200 [Lautropia sp.]
MIARETKRWGTGQDAETASLALLYKGWPRGSDEENREREEEFNRRRNAAGRYSVAQAAACLASACRTLLEGAQVTVEQAIRRGDLPAYTMGSALRVPPPADRAFGEWAGWHEVIAPDLNRWLETMPDMSFRFPSAPGASAPRRVYRHGRDDVLSVVIEAAVKHCGTDSAGPVFQTLHAWALEERAPFTGEVGEVGGLHFNDAATRKVGVLTKANLTHRLSRRRQRDSRQIA